MIGAGIHDGISDDAYHADPCETPSLSSSIAKLLATRTPQHARLAHPRLTPELRRSASRAMDFGSAAHRVLLGAGAEIAALDFSDYKTKAARDARDAAICEGRIPLLAREAAAIENMAAALRWQLSNHFDAWHAFRPGLGRPEQTVVWQERPDPSLPPIWCRARPDWLPATGSVFFDLKTTEGEAGPEGWGRGNLFGFGAYLQEAFYSRGLEAVTGKSWSGVFVVVEKEPPHACAVHGVGGEARAIAEEKVQAAMVRWQWCLARNAWPGYSRRTYWNDAPAWLKAEHESQRDAEEIDRRQNRDLIAAAMEFQAPTPACVEYPTGGEA